MKDSSADPMEADPMEADTMAVMEAAWNVRFLELFSQFSLFLHSGSNAALIGRHISEVMAVVVRNAKIERLTLTRANARKVREKDADSCAILTPSIACAQTDFTEECGHCVVHRRHSHRYITLASVY